MDSKVLITGGAGFIGSHLVEALLSKNCSVVIIDDLSTGRLTNIAHLLDNSSLHFVRADVRDRMVLDRLVSETDVIIHLAAAVGVKFIVDNPVRTILTNVLGTERVLEAALRYDRRMLLASTSEVYGKGNSVPFREEDDVLLGPTSKSRWSYAVSKMLDECLARAYFDEHCLKATSFRLFNTIGPRQVGTYGMVVPRMMKQALAGEDITVFGNGSQRRCFCDVFDSIAGIISLLDAESVSGELFNIGNTHEISMLELAHEIKQITSSRSEIVTIPYAEAYSPGFEDMQRRLPDTTKISRVTGWGPVRTLNQTLCSIRDWMVNEEQLKL